MTVVDSSVIGLYDVNCCVGLCSFLRLIVHAALKSHIVAEDVRANSLKWKVVISSMQDAEQTDLLFLDFFLLSVLVYFEWKHMTYWSFQVTSCLPQRVVFNTFGFL